MDIKELVETYELLLEQHCEWDKRKKCDSLYIKLNNEIKKELNKLKNAYELLLEANESHREQNGDLLEENKKLKEELQGFKNLYENMALEFNKSEEKIDKAIEYIKNIDEEDFIETEHYVELLEILKGDSNE